MGLHTWLHSCGQSSIFFPYQSTFWFLCSWFWLHLSFKVRERCCEFKKFIQFYENDLHETEMYRDDVSNHVKISKRICLGVDPKSTLAGLPYELGNSKIPNLWIAVKGGKICSVSNKSVRINHSITELWQRLRNSIKN